MLKKEVREFVNIPYTSMLKLEVPQMVEQVIEIVEKHGPQALKINEIYNLLIAEKPQIDKLFVWYRSHPFTKELKELRRKRRLNVRKISFHLSVLIQEDVSGVDKSVNLVKSEIERFILDFNSKNEEVKCRKLTQLFALIEEDEELELALSTLKFTEMLNDLRTTHSRILTMSNNKIASLSQRPKEKTSDLIKSVLTATKNIFKDIELAQLKFPEINYNPLFDELNVLLIKYRNLINYRLLYNQRKAKANGSETTELIESNTSASFSTETPESTTTLLSNDADEIKEDDISTNSTDNKKAATTPSKPLQMPDAKENEE
ncbi:MAG TPA: hypothetical protein VJY12_06960 [Dysgonamonadaceae bacterium]|nr:hypothetical protein [Dysgonamonadaceae bacterium]